MATFTKWSDEDRAKQKKFLDDIRASGRINMYDSPRYIQRKFGVNLDEAIEIFQYWADNVGKGKQ